MKAKVIKQFDGCPDGEVIPRRFQPGDAVEGSLAVVAIDAGWAKEDKPETAPAKAGKGRK